MATGLAVALMASALPAIAQSENDKARRTAEIELVAATIWRAVMARDIESLLSYVRPEAVDEARRRLTKPGSDLACALFGTECFQRQPPGNERGRISVAEFFKEHPSVRLRVHYLGMMMLAVPGSDAERKFPAHDLSRWGEDHVNTCLIYTSDAGWRFHSRAGVFFCGTSLVREPDAR